MRILLATAAALAPLTMAAGAHAQVVITNARTTPIATSTATGTGPAAIQIGSGGSVRVTSGVAVTADSNNNVTVDSGGVIGMDNAADGATGLLVNGGITSNLLINGQIIITDSLAENTDTDNDGDADGPFATGRGRYGVRLSGTTPVTGDLRVGESGAIVVEGNESFGIANQSGLIGNLVNLGNVRVLGDNSTAISSTGSVSGQVLIAGTVRAQGAGSSAAVISGDVGGRMTFQGDISATGYRFPTRGSDDFISRLDADDLLQGGSAVVVSGNVAGGVVFDAPPIDADPANPDEDGDGRPDASEGTATINVQGQAPAVVVGSSERDIRLGAVGTGANNYGFINRGTINAQGVYDDITSTGIRLGVDGGRGVAIDGGILNTGTVAALSFEADATAVRIGSGVSTPRFDNSGTITAAASSEEAAEVVAIAVDAGANLPSFSNSRSILATTGGGTANTTAIRDLSGTLTSISNTGSIQATSSPNAAGDAVTSRTVAIDVRANTSGVTFTQTGTPTPAPPTGQPPLVDTDGDGVADENEPVLVGDILLGSGADLVDVRNGTVTGNLDFGAGADRLAISGGAVVRGAIASGDGQLQIDVANGTLEARQSGQTTISGLNIGADGNLAVTIDPASGQSAGFLVNGTANLATGAGLGVRFNSLLTTPSRFTIIDADVLNAGTIDFSQALGDAPYLFVVNAGADLAAGQVFVDARRRTAQEADLIAVERQAFDAFYSALDDNQAVLTAFLNQTDRDGFINLYEQMLPDHSGGPLMSLASGVDAVTRALTGRNASAAPGETSAWVQEINFYADKDKTDTYGFRSEGFGIAGGVERGTGLGAFGVSLAFTSSDIEDPEAEAEEILSASLVELGLYWRAQGQNWTTWARAAGGYASFDSTRALVGEGLNLSTQSDWHGFTLAAAFGASYERNFGRINVRPEAYAEYFALSEDGHAEEGAAGFDLEYESRDGHLFAAVAAVNVGYGFGQNGWLRPELRLGWRQNISVDPGETIARFTSGGPDFRLTPNTIEGGGPIAGLRLNVGNELGMLTVAADAEMLEDYVRYTLLLRASFRF